MSYRVQRHSYIRGRDGTVFTMRSPGGDVVTISAPTDKRKCQYSSTTAPSGYRISRWHAAEIVQALRRKGWEVNAVRYVYVAPTSNQYGGGY
jgi:thioester reductase-like protein